MSFDNIYTYIEENFNIKITDYIFKRDYIKEPLKKVKSRNEKPENEDVCYLYDKLQLSKRKIAKILKTDVRYIDSIIDNYNLKRHKPLRMSYEMLYNEYIINNLSLEELSKKYNISKRTLRYWINDNYKIYKSSNDKLVHIKQSKLKKYGNENYVNIEKAKQSRLEKYGNYVNMIKIKESNLKKYGIENVSFLVDVKKKISVKNTLNAKERMKKMLETNLKKYGVKTFSQTEMSKNRYKDIDYVKNIMNKQYETKKKNNTFGKSKIEDEIYKLLCEKFDDVKRQYKSNLYPFACDFYIPSIDLYIEYQGYWTHGFEPYIDSEKQKEKVKLWESKNTPQYIKAIKDWTERDVIKRQTAKDNNLNWLEFFNMNQFMEWYNNMK